MIASTFPLGKSVFDLVRRGQVDPVSMMVLLGIVADSVALSCGGSYFRVQQCSTSHAISLREPIRWGRRGSTPPGSCRRCVFATGSLPASGKCFRGRADSSNRFDLQHVTGHGPEIRSKAQDLLNSLCRKSEKIACSRATRPVFFESMFSSARRPVVFDRAAGAAH